LRALISVADREGVAAFARQLLELGVDIYATEGTRAALGVDGLLVHAVTELTGDASIPGLGLKTIHPRIHAGLLARRDLDEEMAAIREQGIEPIDIVAVNIRPFAPEVGDRSVPIDEAVRMIEVGGVALLTSAARNFAGVTVASHPRHYRQIVDELRELGQVSAETRQRLAAEAFGAVAAYEAEVAAYLGHVSGVRFPEQLTIPLRKERDLRYGENPQQRAAFYRETTRRTPCLADARQLQGPPPTFNDLLDLDAAYRLVSDFTVTACCIAKQRTPVGLASNESLLDAYRRALECDPVNAWGAVLAINRPLDVQTAAELVLNHFEALVAPGISEEARRVLAQKTDLAVLDVPPRPLDPPADFGTADLELIRVEGGLLLETRDQLDLDRSQLRVVTQRRPSLEELTDLLFAWRTVRHVTSNGVVIARHGALVGVGAGQSSRLTAVEIALHRAADRASGAVLASDAYFPFADAIALAAERGVRAIIQPGGSARDEMAVDVADRHHMAMVFTGRRHFRH
jgi:phosphoribosylaminoimidazolecarboxamide formyltransferase / IMP cyclohydrolase